MIALSFFFTCFGSKPHRKGCFIFMLEQKPGRNWVFNIDIFDFLNPENAGTCIRAICAFRNISYTQVM